MDENPSKNAPFTIRCMKNPFKKIFDMTEKEINVTENDMEETLENTPEQPENNRIAELEKQLEESRSKYLYLFSDFENFKRHSARERMDLIQTAGRDILTSLLPILDDFDRAAKSSALSEGTTLIHHKLVNTVKSKGLVSIETKVGDDFNADIHEAVAEIPAASEALKGKIVDILEPGYSLGERIIRFAKVVVGK